MTVNEHLSGLSQLRVEEHCDRRLSHKRIPQTLRLHCSDLRKLSTQSGRNSDATSNPMRTLSFNPRGNSQHDSGSSPAPRIASERSLQIGQAPIRQSMLGFDRLQVRQRQHARCCQARPTYVSNSRTGLVPLESSTYFHIHRTRRASSRYRIFEIARMTNGASADDGLNRNESRRAAAATK